MLLLAASHKNSYNVYNCNYNIQVFLILRLFKNIQIHIIQVHTDSYYSSLAYIHKKYNISIIISCTYTFLIYSQYIIKN